MGKGLRRKLTYLLLAVLAVGLIMLLRQGLDKSQGSQTYAGAQQLAQGTQAPPPETQAETQPETLSPEQTQPRMVWIPEPVGEDPVAAELAQTDLDALRQVNPQVIGWIRIPDTAVDYPVLQGQDNDYYLHHTWDRQENSVGSIYMEYQNDPGLGDYNTLIYGHNMNDGSMFAPVRRYGEQLYAQAHPYVYLVTDGGVFRYEVFSSYKAPLDSPAYGLSFRQEQTRVDFLTAAVESSVIETGIQPGIRDRILTLSTCSAAGYSNRWVVHARLKMIRVPM